MSVRSGRLKSDDEHMLLGRRADISIYPREWSGHSFAENADEKKGGGERARLLNATRPAAPRFTDSVEADDEA